MNHDFNPMTIRREESESRKSNKKRWREKHRDEINEKRRQHLILHRDEVNLYKRNWNHKNREKVKKYQEKFYATHPDYNIRHKIERRECNNRKYRNRKVIGIDSAILPLSLMIIKFKEFTDNVVTFTE
ncbi:MAG: hypothetical protein HUJ97_08010 [Bacteroidales bacterium]|nr:hypothetical protein [Bacteroidales bacterium]